MTLGLNLRASGAHDPKFTQATPIRKSHEEFHAQKVRRGHVGSSRSHSAAAGKNQDARIGPGLVRSLGQTIEYTPYEN